MRIRLLLILAAAALLVRHEALACSRIPVPPERLVAQADLIVRATAVQYAVQPSGPASDTPNSIIIFHVEEVLKGRTKPAEVQIPGYLARNDDFNDGTVPYQLVRRGGRNSCFANTYRYGSEYLLILSNYRGGYTATWSPAAPTNEQLRGADDPWLKWVRDQIAATAH
jgi:hypothetical protein